ncbi:hypothetical protein MTY66_59310 [Mycolicibacterium sp. TY66]|uniref:hypothetical protein n=1 Tax=Mycobacteriaceae TaxID=1762 RepID=UPI001BB3B019|nr:MULTISPECIES: hypothetical protein [unclassified Mycolicibacterium]MDX1877346.1 hypothetical protein [Mycolicibacterium sp. 141076]BCI84306.1 hypothetical protein MTY66_59310 [Mycolicibacterium sp. TY66]BCJ84072.1 hypothetical protein MTY81_54450 [Mycolicibacterium sp. TY81]
MSETGIWIAWGLPTPGRELHALAALRDARGYLQALVDDGRIEGFDVTVLRPQTTELGGFIHIKGTRVQIDILRRTGDFERWATGIQLIADRVAFVDSWVDRGIDHAIELYEDALREAGLLR